MNLTRSRRDREREGGQIIVLFALSMVVILAMGGLLFTGAQALVVRRPAAGNPGDAGTLAAANLLVAQNGCSAGGNGGSPRTPLVTAATTAVQTNIPGYAAGDVVVTCPTGYDNKAVKVDSPRNSSILFRRREPEPKDSQRGRQRTDRDDEVFGRTA